MHLIRLVLELDLALDRDDGLVVLGQRFTLGNFVDARRSTGAADHKEPNDHDAAEKTKELRRGALGAGDAGLKL